MAIHIVDGNIGGGKTFWAVQHLLKRFYTYDNNQGEYFPLREHVLVSNITDLKIDHISMDAEVERLGGLRGMFSGDFGYVQELRGGKHIPIVFVIDEAQSPDKFHRKFYDPEVFIWFQKCRHYGVDVYLITQDVQALAKEIRILAEYTIHAIDRSSRLGKAFRYKKIVNDTCFAKFSLAPSDRVFRAYKSFTYDEGEKPKSVLLPYIIRFAVLILVIVCLAGWVYARLQSGVSKPKNEKKSQRVAAIAPSSTGKSETESRLVVLTSEGKPVSDVPSSVVSSQPVLSPPGGVARAEGAQERATEPGGPVSIDYRHYEEAVTSIDCTRVSRIEYEGVVYDSLRCGTADYQFVDQIFVRRRPVAPSDLPVPAGPQVVDASPVPRRYVIDHARSVSVPSPMEPARLGEWLDGKTSDTDSRR